MLTMYMSPILGQSLADGPEGSNFIANSVVDDGLTWRMNIKIIRRGRVLKVAEESN